MKLYHCTTPKKLERYLKESIDKNEELEQIKELIAQYPDTLHEACNRIMEISFKAGQKIQGDIIVDLATKEYNAGFSSGSATTIAKISPQIAELRERVLAAVFGTKNRVELLQRLDLMEKNINNVENEK